PRRDSTSHRARDTPHPSHPRQVASGFRNGRVLYWKRLSPSEIANQHHVTRLRAARQGNLFSVARDVEAEDSFRSKVRQLFWRRAVDWLRPEIGNTFLSNSVN